MGVYGSVGGARMGIVHVSPIFRHAVELLKLVLFWKFPILGKYIHGHKIMLNGNKFVLNGHRIMLNSHIEQNLTNQ